MRYLIILILVLFSIQCFGSVLPNRPHIYVEGSAKIEVEPDTMIVTIDVESEDKSAEIAKYDVDNKSQSLIKSCLDIGVDKKSISSSTLQIRPKYDYKDNNRTFSGVRVYRQVKVTLKDLDNYSNLIKALIASNISTNIDSYLSISNEKSLTDQALIEALADARVRAENIAKAEEKELDDVYSISEFDTREREMYKLRSSKMIVSQIRHATASGQSESSELFEPALISAVAKVYVVYLVK